MAIKTRRRSEIEMMSLPVRGICRLGTRALSSSLNAEKTSGAAAAAAAVAAAESRRSSSGTEKRPQQQYYPQWQEAADARGFSGVNPSTHSAHLGSYRYEEKSSVPMWSMAQVLSSMERLDFSSSAQQEVRDFDAKEIGKGPSPEGATAAALLLPAAQRPRYLANHEEDLLIGSSSRGVECSQRSENAVVEDIKCATLVSEEEDEGALQCIKRTWQPSVVKRKRKHGFLSRIRDRHGRRILKRRAAKGRMRRAV